MARKSVKYDPIDIHVGKRMAARMKLLGVTQEKMAKAVGVTFQQVHKRSTGANRISASALFETARALGVPVAFFFEGLPGADTQHAANDEAIALWNHLNKIDAIAAGNFKAAIRRLAVSPAQRRHAAE